MTTMISMPGIGVRVLAVMAAIVCGAFALHAASLWSGAEHGDAIIRVSIMLSPLPAAAFCFLTSRFYGYSRVFGRSFAVLGAAYALVFAGEAIFFHFVDTLGLSEFSGIGESLFLGSYAMLMLHIVTNVRYFAKGLTTPQKALVASVPLLVALAFSWAFLGAADAVTGGLYYNLVFVVASSTILALCVVAFLIFWGTAMGTAWLALLAGIAVGTVGDLVYGYSYALDAYEFGNASGPLWNASHAIVIYALYLHQKSI